jgi:DNA-binding MarR family transcriptional regulator
VLVVSILIWFIVRNYCLLTTSLAPGWCKERLLVLGCRQLESPAGFMSSPRKQHARGTPGQTSRSALERDALLSARALVDRMRTLYRELERMTDAPITVHRALACIGEDPGIPASRLATRLGMQRPAVSHVLKGLAARGWIERRRHEGDQRSVQIHPTADGQQILRATSGRAVGTLQRAVRGLGARQLQQLADGLAALLARLPDAQPPQPRSPAAMISRRGATAPRSRVSGRA